MTRRLSVIGGTLILILGFVAFATVPLAQSHAAKSNQEFSMRSVWETMIRLHPAGAPVRLRIPDIGVDAAVEHVGKTASGAMDVPTQWQDVGWYEPGLRPGENGSAVIAGHLDSDSGKAVFWDLHLLKPGDIVEVDDERGKTLRFEVKEVRRLLDKDAPLAEIFGPSDVPRLNLVTCGGTWDAVAERYDKRLVVFTEMVEE